MGGRIPSLYSLKICSMVQYSPYSRKLLWGGYENYLAYIANCVHERRMPHTRCAVVRYRERMR